MDKKILIIDCIMQEPNGLTLSQLIQKTKLAKATTYHSLEILVKNNLLYRTKSQYLLGPVLLRWINMPQRKQVLVRLLHPYLLDVVEYGGETTHLVQQQGNRGVYIDRVEGTSSIKLMSQIGTELALYSSGAGRAILSLFSDEELDLYFSTLEIRSLTSKTVVDIAKIRKEILRVRKKGYAVEVEQNEKNVECVGISFQWGSTRLAISVSTTLLTSFDKLNTIGKFLLETRKKIIREFNIE